MSWERAVHLAGPVALSLIALRPLVRRRGHHLLDRRTAWLCLLAGIVWPLSVVLRFASGAPAEKVFEVLDAVSLFFGGILFAYGFWALRRVRFSLHSEGDRWAERYRRAEKGVKSSSDLKLK
jgi:hypothetical protein